MRLRPGLDEMKGLRAGEVAAVTVVAQRSFQVKRLRDGKPEETGGSHLPAADLVHGFDGMLPAAAALALATSDDAAMALVEATPADAVGADGRTPLHHAAAFARSAALARRLLAFEPAWAKRADAGGKSAFELLPSTASEEQATVLFEACGPRPLWVMLDPATAACSAAEARAAFEADPDAAARPFAAPEGWAPTEGALVRLRPGLDEKKGLRAGEVAAVTMSADASGGEVK